MKNAEKYFLLCLVACLLLSSIPSTSAAQDSNQGVVRVGEVVTDNASKCKNGQRMCLNNNRYECKKHHWKLIEECTRPSACVSTFEWNSSNPKTACTKTEPCKEGEYACFGSTIYREKEDYQNYNRDNEMYQCKDGQWQFATECSHDQTCKLQEDGTAKCVPYEVEHRKVDTFVRKCSDGQMKCDSGNAVMICRMRVWKYEEVCNEGEVCKNAKCVEVKKGKENSKK